MSPTGPFSDFINRRNKTAKNDPFVGSSNCHTTYIWSDFTARTGHHTGGTILSGWVQLVSQIGPMVKLSPTLAAHGQSHGLTNLVKPDSQVVGETKGRRVGLNSQVKHEIVPHSGCQSLDGNIQQKESDSIYWSTQCTATNHLAVPKLVRQIWTTWKISNSVGHRLIKQKATIPAEIYSCCNHELNMQKRMTELFGLFVKPGLPAHSGSGSK